MELCGAKIVSVQTKQELESAINERTGMMFFLNKAEHEGEIKSDEFIRIGRERGVPTMNDAASDATPEENLWKYTKQGFDLVIFSGGKALRGPQASGLLLGRKNLIDASYPTNVGEYPHLILFRINRLQEFRRDASISLIISSRWIFQGSFSCTSSVSLAR